METDKLEAKIRAIKARTMTAQLLPLMPAIEEKLREGVRQTEIVAALAEEGLKIRLQTFRAILYSYRAQVRKAAEPPAPPTLTKEAGGKGSDAPSVNADDGFNDAINARKRDQSVEKYFDMKPSRFADKPKRGDGE